MTRETKPCKRKRVAMPKARRYTLDEFLKESKRAPRRPKDSAWTAGKPMGRERS